MVLIAQIFHRLALLRFSKCVSIFLAPLVVESLRTELIPRMAKRCNPSWAILRKINRYKHYRYLIPITQTTNARLLQCVCLLSINMCINNCDRRIGQLQGFQEQDQDQRDETQYPYFLVRVSK